MFESLRRQDWLLTGAFLILAVASLTVLASVNIRLFWIQGAWFLLGLFFILSIGRFDLKPLLAYRWTVPSVYLGSAAFLLLTLFFAPVTRHARSWLVVGPFRFQPAELAKVALILLLAYFFAKRHVHIAHLSTLAKSFLYWAIPAGLILFQPDWGSAMVVTAIWIGFLLVSGMRWRHLAIGFFLFAITAFLSWHFVLAPYQKERIVGFLNPAYDPLGINYSVSQAKIAIGSGGFFGKGFRQGTQTQLGYLTESSTDFIFAALAEEWGFFGILVVSAGFFLLLFRIVRVGLRSEEGFSQFVCLGTAILFLTEFTLNVGSNLGLSPVVGVTFPFLSYGGSSLLTKALLLGIIQSIARASLF